MTSHRPSLLDDQVIEPRRRDHLHLVNGAEGPHRRQRRPVNVPAVGLAIIGLCAVAVAVVTWWSRAGGW